MKEHKKKKLTGLELWLEDQRGKFPLAVPHFINELLSKNFETLGHALARKDESAEFLAEFFHKNFVMLEQEDIKKMSADQIKKELELAFKFSNAHLQVVANKALSTEAHVEKKEDSQEIYLKRDESRIDEGFYQEILQKAGLGPFDPKPLDIVRHEPPPYYYINRGIKKEAA
ncbi:MAG: hypothetical protein JWM20_216 [Patescibacteria group bacterium]|nr:hypothetical protein [Patescibacteria group bacterium]